MKLSSAAFTLSALGVGIHALPIAVSLNDDGFIHHMSLSGNNIITRQSQPSRPLPLATTADTTVKDRMEEFEGHVAEDEVSDMGEIEAEGLKKKKKKKKGKKKGNKPPPAPVPAPAPAPVPVPVPVPQPVPAPKPVPQPVPVPVPVPVPAPVPKPVPVPEPVPVPVPVPAPVPKPVHGAAAVPAVRDPAARRSVTIPFEA